MGTSEDIIGLVPYGMSIKDPFEPLELWRLLSPTFLHFGWLHLIFNCLWVWDIGRRIELLQSSYHLLGLAIISGVVANVAQYLMDTPLFGGLSGVVYALLAYVWLWDQINRPLFKVPSGIMVFMLLWLIAGIVGIIDSLGLGKIANSAHVGGLVTGLLLAVITSGLQRLQRNSK